MEWQEVVAGLINGILVIAIVQYLKGAGMSWLKANAPWSLPIIAMVAATVLTAASSGIGALLGYPIDFSPIIAVLTGSLAVTVFDVKHAYSKRA